MLGIHFSSIREKAINIYTSCISKVEIVPSLPSVPVHQLLRGDSRMPQPGGPIELYVERKISKMQKPFNFVVTQGIIAFI